MPESNEKQLRSASIRRSPRGRSVFKSNKRLKSEARASLLGNLTRPVFSVFLYTLSTAVLAELIANFRTESALLSLLFSVIVYVVLGTCSKMLRIGLSSIFLRLHFRRDVKISDLFCAFAGKSDTAVQCCAFLSLIELLFVFPLLALLSAGSALNRTVYVILLILFSLAAFFGVLSVRIRYAPHSYLLLDFPGLPAGTLLRGSARMMQGHRMRLFRLYLSFLPLYVLGVLSFGVARLWVNSYSHSAGAAFYRDLTAKI